MFGYVRPWKDELKVWELQDYEAAYCGLCQAAGQRSGLVARCFLNYDFVFLAMLLMLPEEPVRSDCRCPARLWCGKKPCIQAEGIEIAADAGTILSYWKLKDTVADGSFWARQCARALMVLLGPGYRRAAFRRPDFQETVSQCLSELHDLEEARSPSMDRAADSFARILQAAAPPCGNSARDRAMGQLLYHVGRWIYLLDAWEDLEDDRKKGNYNPISARFPGREEENLTYLRATLRHSRNLAASAVCLLNLGRWEGLIQNIIYLGLPMVEDLVFRGRWRRGRRKKRQETDI